MKFLIVGSGGTGGCIGGYLAKTGEDVTFIARGRHLAAMKEKGLLVKSARVGDFCVDPVKACTMEEYNDTPDVVFVCVKYYSIDEAVSFLKRIAGRDTIIIPILNVYGTGEKMQAHLKCTVADGCVYIFSMIDKPGIISQPTQIFKMYFGLRKGQSHENEDKLREVENILRRAGIEAYYSENIERDALQKFSFVSPMGAAGLYYDGTAGDFMVDGEKREMFFKLVREVKAVGEAMNLKFEVDLEETADKILKGLTKEATTSMQRDIAAGGTSEIDGLIHEMVRLGETNGVDVINYRKISEWAKEKGIK